jgi:endonuclease YncB( thermonuclease family)
MRLWGGGSPLLESNRSKESKGANDDPTLAEAERDAQAAGRGMRVDAKPVPPWEWRATEKGRRRRPVGR